MIIRTYITFAVLCLYVIVFNLYIYELTRIDVRTSKLLYNYLTAGTLLFVLADWKSGFVSRWHEQINFICILCIIVNYIVILFTHHTFLLNPIPMFYAFNGGVLAVTVLVIISSIKYGTFKG